MPDQHYGLAEPLDNVLSQDEIELKKKEFLISLDLSEIEKIA